MPPVFLPAAPASSEIHPDDIVISGISGQLPLCADMDEFRRRLFNKEDLLTSTKECWGNDHPELPPMIGKVVDWSKFDSEFFGFSSEEASDNLYTQCGRLLEDTYEAIVDAGINPYSLKGQKIAVVHGMSFCEREKYLTYGEIRKSGIRSSGHNFSTQRNIIASFIASAFGVTGPTFLIDTACSSALYAVTKAFENIKAGKCDAAIVAVSNFLYGHHLTLQFNRLGVLTNKHQCRPLDSEGGGYVRAEAAGAVILQRARDAKRAYAVVVHAETNADGFKSENITYPSRQGQAKLLRSVYSKLNANALTFMEVHGTGTSVGDPVEMGAIEEVLFNEGRRSSPLLIGSVKSNLGHAEAASGFCSLAKILITFQTGYIIPNINFRHPRKEISSLHSGRCEVVTEVTPWQPGLVAINNFGFGGGNAHIVLRPGPSRRGQRRQSDAAPLLVLASGRTEEAALALVQLAAAGGADIDVELVRLLHELSATPTPGHAYRAFALLPAPSALSTLPATRRCGDARPAVWLALAGAEAWAGAWAAAGAALQRLPAFAAALHRRDAPLADALSDADAFQEALLEVLRRAGVREKGTVPVEQAGKAKVREDAVVLLVAPAGEVTRAARAALGATDRVVALFSDVHDGLIEFLCALGRLYSLGVPIDAAALYMDVPFPVSCETPMISPHVKWDHLRDVLPEREPAHELSRAVDIWISANYGDYEYMKGHVIDSRLLLPATGYIYMVWQTFTSAVERSIETTPVTFENVHFLRATHLPKDYAWNLEINYSAPSSMKFKDESIILRLPRLQTFNKTPAIAHQSPCVFREVIGGYKLLLTAGLFLSTVVNVYLALRTGTRFYYWSILFVVESNLDGTVKLHICIHKNKGTFEVSEGTTAVVTGYVRLLTDEDRSQMLPPAEPWDPSADAASPHMTPRDVYKALRLRGYNYSGLFRGIAAASCDGRRGLLRWDDNWVTFLDCMMQLQLLPDASGTLAVPTGIRRLCIDVTNHTALLREFAPDQVVTTAMVDAATGAVRAGGVDLRGLRVNVIARRKPTGDPVLERYDFAPYRLDEEGEEEEEEETWAEAVRVCAQIALENRGPLVRGAAPLTALEVLTEKAKRPLAPMLLAALGDMPLAQVSLKVFLGEKVKEPVRKAAVSVAAEVLMGTSTSIAEKDMAFLIGSGLIESGWLERAESALAPAGCLITLEEDANINNGEEEEKIRAAGLRLVLRWRRGRHALLLLRKGGWEVDARHATVVHIRQEADEEAGEAFAWLPTLQAALREARRPEQRVLLVAEGQPLAGAQGLFNCLRQEPGPGSDKLRLYVLEEGAKPFSFESDVYRRQLELDVSVNELRGGRWGCPRHFLVPVSEAKEAHVESVSEVDKHAYCDVKILGDLSSFSWFEGDLHVNRPASNTIGVLVNVYYSALNFKDVMIATGKLNASNALTSSGQKSLLGFEIAGRTADGRRVMGISTKCAAIATLVSITETFLWDVPENWTLEQAATVPAVYCTALYALMKRGRMRKGESVLVHAGSGGVGQAAIHLALAQGCRVFATAGTDAKRRFLLQTFPQLAAEDVGNSRDCSFEALVLRRTAGRGVDLVLNSLAGDKLLASLRCLAPGGRFLEIGKFDMEQNTALEHLALRHCRSFHGILLDKFWTDAPLVEQKVFAEEFSNLLKVGAIKPLPTVVFKRSEVEEAFRYMASGKHVGKVLIRIREEEQVRTVIPRPLVIKANRRFHCQPGSSYVICGGLGGLGLEVADWLVSRGCHNLVLTSRKGVSNGYQARKMLLWQRKGVRVHIFTGDAATHAGADALLRAANALAPLAAIFNLAVVLRDGLFDNQTVDAFAESYRCKALATRRLDKASRRLCPSLSHFVVFSSVSCGRGNAGQTNYGLANSVMEGVVRGRREVGLPATAVQWGAVGDVGLVADMRDDDRQLEIGGTLQQRLSSCLEVLDSFLAGGNTGSGGHVVSSSMVVAEKKACSHGETIVSLVAEIFGIKDVRTVSPESTLVDLGLDSMMAVEIQQALERDFSISLAVQDLRALSFARLKEMDEQYNVDFKDQGNRNQKTLIQPQTDRLLLFWKLLVNHPAQVNETLEGDVALTSMTANTVGGGVPVLMVPGIEDLPFILEPLATRLEGLIYCLQMGAQCDRTSLSQMVDLAMPVVKKLFVDQTTFKLAGYSFGGLLALEIAHRLEEEGLKGSLAIVDASPNLMRKMVLSALKGEFEDIRDVPDHKIEELHTATFLQSLEEISAEEAWASLEACGSWKKLLERALLSAEAKGLPPHTLARAFEKVTARVLATRDYNWPETRIPLTSRAMLVCPSRSLLPIEDYGLSKIFKDPIDVYCIEGVDHSSIPTCLQTAEIINNFFKGN